MGPGALGRARAGGSGAVSARRLETSQRGAMGGLEKKKVIGGNTGAGWQRDAVRWETGATEPRDCACPRPWVPLGIETSGINASGDGRQKGLDEGRGRQCLSGDLRERTPD